LITADRAFVCLEKKNKNNRYEARREKKNNKSAHTYTRTQTKWDEQALRRVIYGYCFADYAIIERVK
jgi:hypothetical protein